MGFWLLDLTADALAENPDLSSLTGAVQDSGEGRWTVMTAVEESVSGRGLVYAPLGQVSFVPGSYVRREDALGDAL